VRRRRVATSIAVGAVAALAPACGPRRVHASIVFEPVLPQASGFTFRHELPGGQLDNLPKAAMGGVALLDYDGDGRVDVFCPNGGWRDGLANGATKPAKVATARLYRNLGSMRFEDVTEKARVGFEGFALGACVGDFDGDGRPDVFVSAYGRPALYRNRGDGSFEDVAEKAGIPEGLYAGATFLDYDRDGVLDLFASQYVDPADVDPSENRPGQFAGPAAYKGRPARLFHGRGDGTFEDTTAAAGVGRPGRGMGVLATDVDDDGWIDLFVANDAQENFVWRNRGNGTFAEAAARLGMALGPEGEMRASMGVTAADLDGDGRLEFVVPDTHGGCVYSARGPYFVDRAADWALTAATHHQTGWSDVALDVDCDGDVDLWKVHGDIRTLDPQWSKLVVNRGRNEKGGTVFDYEPPPPRQEYLRAEARITGRGAAAADFDDDGLEDLLAIGLEGEAALFRNVTTGAGHWLRVRLVGSGKNTMALGAKLTGRAGDHVLVQEVSGASAYLSAPDTRLHFGLGTADTLEDVVVRWPDGKQSRVGSLAADRDHVIRQQ
jgi:enediyne biosynthesis protein E4